MRLKYLREQRGKTMRETAAALGMPYTTYINYEKQLREPNSETLVALANYYDVTVDYLIGRSDSPTATSTPDLDPSKYGLRPLTRKRLPLLGEIACGEPRFADENRECYVEVGTDIAADFCLRAKGDSMTGARINDGDIVFIRSSPSVDNGQIAAVIIGDEATLKRVFYYQNKKLIILRAENPRYQDIIFEDADLENVRILGLAVAFQSDVI